MDVDVDLSDRLPFYGQPFVEGGARWATVSEAAGPAALLRAALR